MEGNLRLPERLHILEVLPKPSLFLVTVVTLTVIGVYKIVAWYREYCADIEFGRQHGCSLPPKLPNKWPLGVDRLRELWHWNSQGHLLEFLCSLANHYEPRNNSYQFILFGPRTFHTLHPKNVEVILSSNFQEFGFGARRGVFFPLLGDGIFTQEGTAWKHSRELLRKQFVRIQYQKSDLFREHIDNLLACLPASEGVVDLQPLFFRLTLDTTTDLLLGKSVHSLCDDSEGATADLAFTESFNTAQAGLAKRFRIAPWHFFYKTRSFQRACSFVHRFVDDYVRSHDTEQRSYGGAEETTGFISQVAQESSSSVMVRDQLINVLLAGRDTTACCLSWTIRLLVRHPKVLHRLREEIASTIGDDGHPSREQLQKMSFLRNIIRESLRLYPPVPLNNRTAMRTTMLPTGGGPDGNSPILVRRGEVVVYSMYVNARRKSIWGPDANEFLPDRWIQPEVANIGWAYFPFSGGPRICLGQDFALMEVSYTIVRLLQAFPSVTIPIDEPDEPIGNEKQLLTLVLSCAEGCRVALNRSTKFDGL